MKHTDYFDKLTKEAHPSIRRELKENKKTFKPVGVTLRETYGFDNPKFKKVY